MNFLNKHSLPSESRQEKKYLEQLDAAHPEDFRGLGDADLAGLRAWLQHRHEHNKHRVEQMDAIFNWSCIVLIAAAAGFVLLQLVKGLIREDVSWLVAIIKSPASTQWLDTIAAGCMALIAFSLVVVIISAHFHDRAKERADQFKSQLRRLAPLRETGGCRVMLALMDEYPEIAAYRDDVLQAGREILKIDLELVTQISDQIQAANAAKSHSADCRLLHGLPADVEA